MDDISSGGCAVLFDNASLLLLLFDVIRMG